jgi:hypothetical protein
LKQTGVRYSFDTVTMSGFSSFYERNRCDGGGHRSGLVRATIALRDEAVTSLFSPV